jgi:ABC-2 type transport system permease protein
VLVPVAVALGWRPEVDPVPLVGRAVVLATIAFAGLALLMAGTLPGLVTLAAANGVYVVLLLFGDMVIPSTAARGSLGSVAGLLPTAALAELLRAGVSGGAGSATAWLGSSPLRGRVAAFRWECRHVPLGVSAATRRTGT